MTSTLVLSPLCVTRVMGSDTCGSRSKSLLFRKLASQHHYQDFVVEWINQRIVESSGTKLVPSSAQRHLVGDP